MKALRLRWYPEKGWIIETPVYLDDYQIKRIADFAFKVQVERLRGLPPGDRKEELKKSIIALKEKKISQRLIEIEKNTWRLF